MRTRNTIYNKAFHLWQVKAWTVLGVLMLLAFNPLVAQEIKPLVDRSVQITMCRSHLLPVNLNNAVQISLPAEAGTWYDATTNLPVSNIVVPSRDLNFQSFYFLVEHKHALCELEVGDRYIVDITINDVVTPTGVADQFFCNDPSNPKKLKDLELDEGQGSIRWYASSEAGSAALSLETELVDGTTYYAAIREEGCGESTVRFPVLASLDIQPKLKQPDLPSFISGVFDLSKLVIEDENKSGGEISFHTSEPDDALDMDSVLLGDDLLLHTIQNIWVMCATVGGCFDVIELSLNIDACDFNVEADVQNVLCYGGNTGSIRLEVINNTASNVNFTYMWNDGNTGAFVGNLKAGTYTVTITPDNGCDPIDKTYEITQPDLLKVFAEVVNHETGPQLKDGRARAVVEGGTAEYTYLWNDPQAQTTVEAINLDEGTYKVTVTDANGCQSSGTVSIEGYFFIPDGFSPNGDNVNERFEITGLEKFPDAKLEVYNRWNSLVYSKESYGNEERWGADEAWWDGKTNGKLGVGSGLLPADNYIYILKCGGKVYKGVVFINW